MSGELRITVNGESLSVPTGTSVAGLLERLGMANPRVAVERNRDIVPKASYRDTELLEGDVFEVVELVGGG
jgi:thiamine biosynthesis protein ThiS